MVVYYMAKLGQHGGSDCATQSASKLRSNHEFGMVVPVRFERSTLLLRTYSLLPPCPLPASSMHSRIHRPKSQPEATHRLPFELLWKLFVRISYHTLETTCTNEEGKPLGGSFFLSQVYSDWKWIPGNFCRCFVRISILGGTLD